MRKYEQVIDEIYKNRYEIAIQYTTKSLCYKFNIPYEALARGLKEKYNFNFRDFRRKWLCFYVVLNHYKGGGEICRELQISKRSLIRLRGEANFKLSHGGDRRGKKWREKALGSKS